MPTTGESLSSGNNYSRAIVMAFHGLSFVPPDNVAERLVADLSELGAEGFEERDGGAVVAYIPDAVWTRSESTIRSLLAGYDVGVQSVEFLADRNWNEEWEATIQPIDVAPFRIRASWHGTPTPPDRMELIIDPKMSFGTGYHETTRLMLRALPRFVKNGQRVLDAGTGTGVLGIAALKLGAASCFGFDIDEWSTDNASENALRNGVEEVFEVVEGDQSVVPGGTYDLVLANINRNALLAMMNDLLSFLAPDGALGLAGLLVTDRADVMKELEARPVTVVAESTEGEWWSVWVEHARSNN